MALITVFTPTYNRVILLKRLFESLLMQTSHDFEWLVVDDGSEDDTCTYMESLQTIDLPFPIVFHKVENGGKHRAINMGVSIASGTHMFIVDSDDWLMDDAIAAIYDWINSLPDTNEFAGVSGLRGHDANTPMGNTDCFGNSSYIDKTNIERYGMHSLWDMSEVYRMDILRAFPFPEFQGEKFLSEGVVWDRIAHAGYKIRWYNRIIYICEYLNDGLTQMGSSKLISNPEGYAVFQRQKLQWYPYTFRQKIAICYDYYVDVVGYRGIKGVGSDLGINVLVLLMIIWLKKIRLTRRRQ